MPPQNSSPTGQFDFILKDDQKKSKSFWPPTFPKVGLISLIVVVAILIIIILYNVILGGRVGTTDQLIDIAARAQEIARVSDLASRSLQNTEDKDLATTVSAAMNSQERQITIYLQTKHFKVNPKKLAVRLNGQTDISLQIAAQNNRYDQTYITYLKTSLSAYQTALSETYKSASKNPRAILVGAHVSTQTILSASQIVNLGGS